MAAYDEEGEPFVPMRIEPSSLVRRLRSGMKASVPRVILIQRLPKAETQSVLLTFDDGPHPDVTPGVLDRLAAYDARAVFFVVGRRLKRSGDLLERTRQAGHLIGNHSYLHRDRYVLSGGPQASFLEYLSRLLALSVRDRGSNRRPGASLPATGWPADVHDSHGSEAPGTSLRDVVSGR